MKSKKSPSAIEAVEGAKFSIEGLQDSTAVTSVQRQDQLAAYIEAGFALLPIPHGLKGPQRAGWNRREAVITTIEQAQAQLNGSCNIGLAHAYSDPTTCATDIDNLEKARAWLAERGVDLDALLNAPDAVRILSPREGSAKLIYQLQRPMPSVVIKGPDGGTILEFRCASKDGLTVQDVLPPSIHPIGLPYTLDGDVTKMSAIPEALFDVWQRVIASKATARGTAAPQGDLSARFAELLNNDEKLRKRWDGNTDGLGDTSRSGLDLSMTALLVIRGFNDAEITVILQAFPHGKVAQDGRGDDYINAMIAKARKDRTLSRTEPMWNARRLIAERFTAPGGTALLIHSRGDIYQWPGGAWRLMAPADMEAAVYAYLEGGHCLVKKGREAFAPNRARVGEVTAAARAATHVAGHKELPCWLEECEGDPDARDMLVVSNGNLHLPTRTLLPHTPRLFTLTRLLFAYDANAEPPMQWLRFLHELWPDDRESIAVLQEWFGYLLTSDSSRQKILMIVGPKRAGKGTIARVLRALLGAENCAGPTLASLATNFGLQPLIGKLLAIINDARLGTRPDQQVLAERMLSISGEDALTIDRKYGEAWTGRLGVRFMILTNELPRITDTSGALASRFVVLRLTRSWLGAEDLGLADRLMQELPGILNWALNGLTRLRSRGQFRQPAAALALVQELEDLTSPVGAFLRESCVVAPSAQVSCGQLFQIWRIWCHAHGREHPGTEATFGRDLRAVLPDLQVVQPRVDGRQRRFYRGIGLADGLQGNGEREFFNRLHPTAGG